MVSLQRRCRRNSRVFRSPERVHLWLQSLATESRTPARNRHASIVALLPALRKVHGHDLHADGALNEMDAELRAGGRSRRGHARGDRWYETWRARRPGCLG